MSKPNRVIAAAFAIVCASCIPQAPPEESEAPTEVDEHLTPPEQEPITLRVGNYNVEWFGDSQEGPTNEQLQLENVAEVLQGSDVDLSFLEEVVSVDQFEQLLARLPGFAGFVSNDPSVENGSRYYKASEQKLAVVYREDLVRVADPRLVLFDHDYDFGSRPPMALDVTVASGAAELTLIGLHMKAMSDPESYDRRKHAAAALQSLLDGEMAGRSVLVIGDWNDDIDTSIAPGQPTPFAALASDADYRFLTRELSAANVGSRVVGHSFIDHQLVGGPLAEAYVAGSTTRLDTSAIPDYGQTTTDHYPIASTFQFEVTKAQAVINEVLANEPGSDTAREFVEIVDPACSSLDISRYSLSVGDKVVFTFPANTVLPSGQSAVVFGRSSRIPAGLTGAFGASGLGLLNGGGAVSLVDAAGHIVSNAAWSSSVDGVSIVRSIEGDGSSPFIAHPKIAGETSSPGRSRDGSAWAIGCSP